MWNPQIPENEVENVLSLYWQMLREIEVDSYFDPSKRLIVEGGYKVLNRCGVTDKQPTYR